MSSYPACEDVKAVCTMTRVDRLEIHLDTVIMIWEEDIDGITGSLPGYPPHRRQCLGGRIRTDPESTMVPLR
jgi:hypothetical protein